MNQISVQYIAHRTVWPTDWCISCVEQTWGAHPNPTQLCCHLGAGRINPWQYKRSQSVCTVGLILMIIHNFLLVFRAFIYKWRETNLRQHVNNHINSYRDKSSFWTGTLALYIPAAQWIRYTFRDLTWSNVGAEVTWTQMSRILTFIYVQL